MTFSWVLAAGGAGSCSVLGILFVIDDRLVVLGGRRRWRVERFEISVRNGRPSRCLVWLAALARGAS